MSTLSHERLLELPNLRLEALAASEQGWLQNLMIEGGTVWWNGHKETTYVPTTVSEQGTSQCIALMIEAGMEVDFRRKFVKPYNGSQWFMHGSGTISFNDQAEFQRAVVILFILWAQSNNKVSDARQVDRVAS